MNKKRLRATPRKIAGRKLPQWASILTATARDVGTGYMMGVLQKSLSEGS
ncbi:hypothetical protein [Nitrosospira sp. Nsp1]|nr:hypothetical protein [Nitrosospira sp. Nsp1]SCX56378.1 hypothetical protein SAMN05720354_11734 [Nitrosospira sp. Nsp1]